MASFGVFLGFFSINESLFKICLDKWLDYSLHIHIYVTIAFVKVQGVENLYLEKYKI